MNNIRLMTIRTYKRYRKYPSGNAGIKAQIKFKNMETFKTETETNPDELMEDDTDLNELDFMNLDMTCASRREEKKQKELLKIRMVRRKYFKEVEPSFLTLVERDQIQKLHASNPDEWTPEKLSESFPALPETIRKILKTKWIPQSMDRAIKYDSNVIENWKNFKIGELVVNDRLHEHLTKFKNRQISLTDRESLLKNIIPPKMEFPKPQSSVFSSIITEVENTEQSLNNQKLISCTSDVSRNEKELIITDKKIIEESIVQTNKFTNTNSSNQKNKMSNKLILNEFLKAKLKKLYETSPEEGITLLQTYRQHTQFTNLKDESSNINNTAKEPSTKENKVTTIDNKKESVEKSMIETNKFTNTYNSDQENNKVNNKLINNDFIKMKLKSLYETSPEEGINLLSTHKQYVQSTNLKDVISDVNNTEKKQDTEERNVATVKIPSNESTLTVSKDKMCFNVVVTSNKERDALDTYVKEWKTSIDTEFKYANSIKIPKNVRKEGMTYRIKDCYYDDDGEFLYRTPGLKN
ncbi:uncharacterized protein LOC122402534 [Colletes gigas]|uniref:uncharacterized protein LOC122402534 n=1 Tax=Colletes gigas TaxID=935657 RepID=UPI001C9AFF2E|nr:uncharacterized protein LOC122402534 [Colletes gigas]